MNVARLRLQVGIFALISLLGISFVGVRYLGWFDRSYVVYVQAEDAGGAYTHAAVAYRGVPVGRVGDISLTDDGVRLELLIESDIEVPRDVAVVVAQRSAVGEQYVDLRPASSAGPYLADGDTLTGMGTPLPMETLLANLDGLISEIDPADLSVVIDELGAAFDGNEDALGRLLVATELLIDDALAHLPETVDLLRDGQTVLQTQLDSASAIRTWADQLAELTTTLAESDADLRDLITTAPTATDNISTLLADLDPSLGVLLGNMITVNGIAVRRLANVEVVLVSYPMVVAGGFTVTPGDGTAHFGLVLNFDNPPPCIYGSTDSYTCTQEELDQGSAVRGWQNAPGPSGPPIIPVPLPGLETPTGDDGAGSDDAGPDEDDTAVPRPSGYDPLTGLLVDQFGTPVQFGGTGGHYELAGEQSWKQLLLMGLTP